MAVEARLLSGRSGGVESVVIGLAHSLSQLTDGDEEYLFCVWTDNQEWLRPYVSGNARILELGPRPVRRQKLSPKDALKRIPGARTARNEFAYPLGKRSVQLQRGDPGVERAGADLVHFPFQAAFLTELPSIYHPHDLQHLHLPGNFTRRERIERAVRYRAFCEQASLVAVASTWTKNDILEQFRLPAEKIAVVPLAPILGAYDEPAPEYCDRLRAIYGLPTEFVLYPAQTWPHKNHLSLLDALSLLRTKRGLVVPLVCTGGTTDFFPTIERHIRRLGLGDQVRFLGFVPTVDLKCLYRLARATVIPTKFEAASGPLWDSFIAGTPAACSTVTSLPEQAGDAALLFDPERPDEIAGAIAALWTDTELRAELRRRGAVNVQRFSWNRTARIFRAHYRRIASRQLAEADLELLRAPPPF